MPLTNRHYYGIIISKMEQIVAFLIRMYCERGTEMSTIRVGGSPKDADVTFEQREQALAEEALLENREKKAEEKSAFSHFAQQNIDSINVMMKIAESPLAAKIYFLIVKKMNNKNALVASYQFFMDYFGKSKSSVRRAIQLLESENVLQIKRRGGITVYLLNPEIVWKGKGSHVKYCEFEGSIIFTEAEWGSDYE